MREANQRLNKFRVRRGKFGSDDSLGTTGAFLLPIPKKNGTVVTVLASRGGGWDHVSVSLPDRCPTWEEMCYIKSLFFRDDEWAMQLHPPASENISYHDFTLHLWRPQTQAERDALCDDERVYPTPGPLPLPPAEFVGPRTAAPERDPCS